MDHLSLIVMPLLLKVKSRIAPLALSCLVVLDVAARAQDPVADAPTLPDRVLKPLPEPSVVLEDLAGATAENTVIEIFLAEQRLTVQVAGKRAVESPVSTGRKSTATPEGEFRIKGRVEKLEAAECGNFVDKDNNVIVPGVYAKLDEAPRGTRFAAVAGKYALEVEGESGKTRIIAGHVRSTPSSDGTIVVPEAVAWALFEKIPDGATVRVLKEIPAADAEEDPATSAPSVP